MRSEETHPVNTEKIRLPWRTNGANSGEECAPGKADPLKNLFVVMEACVKVPAVFLKSIQLLYSEARRSKGTCTEHLCYDCWASKADDPSHEDFLRAQNSTCKWRYVCLADVSLHHENAWEFLFGAHAGALRLLEEERVKTLEECRAQESWNRNCDEDALRMTYCATAEDAHT